MMVRGGCQLLLLLIAIGHESARAGAFATVECDFENLYTSMSRQLGRLSEAAGRVNVDVARAVSYYERQGFKCSIYDETSGVTCKGSIDKSIYPEPIAIIIPAGYKATDRPDSVLHLHGHMSTKAKRDLDFVLDKYKFGEAFTKSKRNSIMIVPFSAGKSLSHKEFLMPEAGFQKFMNKMNEMTFSAGLSRTSTAGSLALTGHSGAYSTIGGILQHKKGSAGARINEVYLFDSVNHVDNANDPRYELARNSEQAIAKFAKNSPPNRFGSVFIPQKKFSGTSRGNYEVWRASHQGAGVDTSEKAFLDQALPADAAASVVRAQLGKGQAYQMSSFSHEETVREYYSTFLSRP